MSVALGDDALCVHDPTPPPRLKVLSGYAIEGQQVRAESALLVRNHIGIRE